MHSAASMNVTFAAHCSALALGRRFDAISVRGSLLMMRECRREARALFEPPSPLRLNERLLAVKFGMAYVVLRVKKKAARRLPRNKTN